MRLLQTFDDKQAARLAGDALYVTGIHSTIRSSSSGQFDLWVHEEDRMDEARDILAKFRPNDERLVELSDMAQMERRRKRAEEKALERRSERIRKELADQQAQRIGTVTMTLIGISVVVFFLTSMGENTEVVTRLTLTDFNFVPGIAYPVSSSGLGILATQPWRLITPMFLHFGILHIFFNLWWLKDLGTIVERQFSGRYLLALVLAIGVVSHLAQYYIAGPTVFGGMSGVVYGLFTFIWIRGRMDPTFPYRIPRNLVIFMMAWFALGFTGRVGPIANYVHAGGLVVGGVWGALSARFRKR
ncbi:MAG: rhomboid family intramembrane serine protease [Polyangiales bacterium]